jgi:hypothetical protein
MGSSFALVLRGAAAVVVVVVAFILRKSGRVHQPDTAMIQPVVLVERDIESVRTQVIIQTFSDRVLVIVTQLQKAGTLVRQLRFCSAILFV